MRQVRLVAPIAAAIAAIAVAVMSAAGSAVAQPVRRPTPDPKVTYAVPLDDSPADGPRHAKVTIVMGMEFACPYCRKSWDTLTELRKKYGNDLRVVYKTFIVHYKDATPAAMAACAGHLSGKWRAVAEGLWARAFDRRDFSRANLVAIGRAAGIDSARFEADMHAPRCAADLLRDMAELKRLGQAGTPTFWINGRVLEGAQPIERFETLIDEELARADDAIAHGVKLADYYDQAVLGRGAAQP
jgi:protein-disulfide isomerase